MPAGLNLKDALYADRFKSRFGNPEENGTKPVTPEGPGDVWFDHATNVLSISNQAGSAWVDYDLDTLGALNNFSATTDPTTTDDSGSGYGVGSLWVNTTLDKAFICLDSTATAAVWNQIDASGVQNNYSASTAPTATDDSGSGYSVGSVWIDTTADASYICVDSTATAAVWNQIDASGGGGGNGRTLLVVATATTPSLNQVSTSGYIDFDTEVYDPQGFFTPTNSEFTIPSGYAGDYIIEWSLRGYAGQDDVQINQFIRIDRGIVDYGGAHDHPYSFTIMAYGATEVITGLTVGQDIEFYSEMDSANSDQLDFISIKIFKVD